MGQDKVHWTQIINSTAIVLILAALIAHIMKKALNIDIAYYEVNIFRIKH